MQNGTSSTAPNSKERPSILVIEPSLMLRKAYSEVVERHGLEVRCCATVVEALDLVCLAKPAGILTALELPGLTGASLVAALRSSSQFRAIPIALITSTGDAGAAMEFYRPDAVLNKSDLLEQQIDEFLDHCWLSGETSDAEFGLAGKRVLVAEDSSVSRILVGRLLHVLGAEVELVADGIEAVDAATRSSFDLVLMDIEMPRMTGREAAVLIARQKPRLPIIAISGHDPEDAEGWSEFCSFLEKPVKREDLLRVCSHSLAA